MKNEHIEGVQKLIEQLDELYSTCHDISVETIKKTTINMIQLKDIYLNFIAMEGNKIVGFISTVFYKTFFHPGGTVLINELIVDNTFRGKGIGIKLIAKIKEIAKQRGMNEIEVGTTFNNKKAINFYKKVGLTDEGLLLGEELES
jgi:GNAT superfamily N-acetyltransferase